MIERRKTEQSLDLRFSELEKKVDCLVKHFDRYRTYLDLAIAREARREKFQRIVMEKTVIALIWALIVGITVLLWDGAVQHLKQLWGLTK